MDSNDKTRAIHDKIHGQINLTAEEVCVIDHPLFQRMRRICQTGLLRYVWHTATHTRFEHSIGVVHTTQMMLNALLQGSKSGAKKLYPLEEAELGQAVRYHELSKQTREQVTRLARLCALAHDLGHGPLSHAFEAFAPRVEEIEPFLDDARLDAIRPLGVLLTRGKNGRIRHEALSCILFNLIWDSLDGPRWTPQAVGVVLLGDAPEATDVPEEIRPWLPMIRDLVSSAPIDADRMDYLLRDSESLGVSYGLYEADRILKSILCVRWEGGYRLGWRLSGLRAIESFVTSRFHMFAQCYTHKTVRATELMLDAIKAFAERAGVRLIRTTQGLDVLVKDYEELGDEAFMRALTGVNAPGAEIWHVHGLSHRLRARQLWKRLYEFERDETHLTDALVERMRVHDRDANYLIDRLPLKAMKDLDRGSFLMRLDREGKYSITENRSWIEASPLMRTLRDEEQSRVRLFVEIDEPRRPRSKQLRELANAEACKLRDRPPKPE